MTKFIRDPIHDLIRIEEKNVIKVIDLLPMQRLRRIKQLGVANFVYPGADHSRLAHSLGAYHLAKRIIYTLNIKELFKNKHEYNEIKNTIIYSALLHDIGHGPFSHAFEAVLKELSIKRRHEDWTIKIIKEHDPLSVQLSKESKSLADNVCDVLKKSHNIPYVIDIVSSQLDIDRFDYLLRDSHMTGVGYGRFDLEWMIRTLKIRLILGKYVGSSKPEIKTIVVDKKRGLSGIDQYIIGRHYMYKHVYYHKTIRAIEGLLKKIIIRMIRLTGEANTLKIPAPLAEIANNKKLTAEEYMSLNDCVIYYWIEECSRECKDPILKDLCKRFVSRNTFQNILSEKCTRNQYSEIKDIARERLNDRGLDAEYYLIIDETKDAAYKPFFHQISEDEKAQEILLYADKGDTISLYSEERKELLSSLGFEYDRLFLPSELVDKGFKAEIEKILITK